MAHFAKINKENIVENVIVADTKEWCESVLGGEWIQTSYNTYRGVHNKGGEPLRKNFASVGYTYDRERDAFIPPQPYPSWLLDEETCNWVPPIPRPDLPDETSVLLRVWDEENRNWKIINRE